ncbi:hypothetical protein F5884DRAFT_780804 [Xylogone sp. PMI_703]|nr:hypothetical protein F5884DRAFT_780804 [Xylogone sp. PMI_703]
MNTEKSGFAVVNGEEEEEEDMLSNDPNIPLYSLDNKGQSEVDGGSAYCSICTEEFHDGEYIRILPCAHIYHRRCIDPWLVGFVGSCPLWLVTLG